MPKRTTDEEFLKRLEETAPEVLSAKVDFDALVGKILAAGDVDTGRTPKRRKAATSQKRKRQAKSHSHQ
jgi:hypothetical protein